MRSWIRPRPRGMKRDMGGGGGILQGKGRGNKRARNARHVACIRVCECSEAEDAPESSYVVAEARCFCHMAASARAIFRREPRTGGIKVWRSQCIPQCRVEWGKTGQRAKTAYSHLYHAQVMPECDQNAIGLEVNPYRI